MNDSVEGLKPALVWKYFAEISRIPRGSKNEKAISAYVMETAQKLGLEVKRDKFLTVLVKKPASPGRENVPSVCLQGHLDMVCEKNKDTVHDFEKDPIELVIEGNILRANGTTLGADNGVAVATNLAIMEDKSLEHGPLEFLFTVDEETGLTGANNLKSGFMESKILLNLDSEEEGAVYIGCSGGKNITGTWKVNVQNVPPKHKPFLLTVKGLRGGHSGLEIHTGRGNSLKCLNRTLTALTENGARISRIDGGNKSNAIPREAEAVVYLPTANVKKALATVERIESMIRAELSTVEPDLSIFLEAADPIKKATLWKKDDQSKILKTLSAMPHGVIKMSADIPNLVETSTNLAIIKTEKKNVTVITSQRSSVASEIVEITDSVAALFVLGGAKVSSNEGYPGWKPNVNSPILAAAKASYFSLYGREPEVKAIHAGLECGIIGKKYPGMDMISFGPTLADVHSPDEKIYIDTVDKFWLFLLEILKNVK